MGLVPNDAFIDDYGEEGEFEMAEESEEEAAEAAGGSASKKQKTDENGEE